MKRKQSFITITLIYLFALTVAILVFQQLPIANTIYKFLICDVVATLIVWLFSLIFKNSSVYDPYWSVAPLLMVWLFNKNYSFQNIVLISVISFWGIRLTVNWAVTFKGLAFEDWRYRYYHDRFPKMWPLTNLFGIHLMPTIVVILVITPALTFLQALIPANIFTYLASALCVVAILLELFADIQNHRFKAQNPNKTINTGLWKYTRHPNYLGEILMWWGVYLMLLSLNVNHYWFFIGPLLNTLMFVFISIPLMEKRQLSNKPDYQEYKQRTNMLIPWFPKTTTPEDELENL